MSEEKVTLAGSEDASNRPEIISPDNAVGASGTDASASTSKEEEDDEFFAKSFSFDPTQYDEDDYDAAFADGLKSIFESDPSADDVSDSDRMDDVSDAELIQRDLELERNEALDSTILQNDSDFLYEAGEKYEAPRATDSDFDRSSKTTSAPERKGIFSRSVVRPDSILEAMLFVGDRDNKPLSLKRARELIRNVSEEEALEILADLNERYYREGAPYKIIRDGDGYRMTLLDKYRDVAERFGGKTKEFKLSQTAIDVLALIAYKQPITLPEILEVRGSATGVLAQLVRRDLISVEKQTVDKKKVSVYRTTDRFLALFNLKSLGELPVIGDIDYR